VKVKLRQAVVVVALLALVAYLPAFILWCGPLFYFYNQEICEEIGASNLWHLILLAAGIALCILRPRATGLRWGRISENLKLIGLVSLGAWAMSAVGALLMDHPFEDAPVGMYLMTPIGEELIFRGFAYAALVYVFPGKPTRSGLSVAVVGSALLFGFWHLSMAGTLTWWFAWIQAAYTALAGLLLGLLRERTGSVLPGAAAHMGSNYLVATL
jgi:membrane protease YdiL (CAAX protease family)